MTFTKPSPLPEPRAFKLNTQEKTLASPPPSKLKVFMQRVKMHMLCLWHSHSRPLLTFGVVLLALLAHTLWLIADQRWINPDAYAWPYPLNTALTQDKAAHQDSVKTEQKAAIDVGYVGLFTPRGAQNVDTASFDKVTPENLNRIISTLKQNYWPLPAVHDVRMAPTQQGHWMSVIIPGSARNDQDLLLGLPLIHNFKLFDITGQTPHLLSTVSSTGLENLRIKALNSAAANNEDVHLLGYFENAYPTVLAPRLIPATHHLLYHEARIALMGLGCILAGMLLILSTHSKCKSLRHNVNLVMVVHFAFTLFILNSHTQLPTAFFDPLILLLGITGLTWVYWRKKISPPHQKNGNRTILSCLALGVGLSALFNLWGPATLLSLSALYFAFARHYLRSRSLNYHAPRKHTIDWLFSALVPMLAALSLSAGLAGYAMGALPIHGSMGLAFEHYLFAVTLLCFILLLAHVVPIFFDWFYAYCEHQRLKHQLNLEAIAAAGILQNLKDHLPLKTASTTAMKSTAPDLKVSPRKNRLKAISSSVGLNQEKVADYADIAALLSQTSRWHNQPANLDLWIKSQLRQWEEKMATQNLQLIVSIKPDARTDIMIDEEKLTHICKTLLDLSATFSTHGNVTLRLETHEDNQGKMMLWVTVQDCSTQLPAALQQLLETNWQQLNGRQLSIEHLQYLRLLLSFKWIDLNGGHFNFSSDSFSGSKYQAVLCIRPQSRAKIITPMGKLASALNHARTLLMTYDTEYATTMAEQANALNTTMRLSTSVKQAKQTLMQASRANEQFNALIFDFSRDAESLQGFILELREESQYDLTPIILLTRNTPRVEYLAQIFKRVYILPRPSYYPQLTQLTEQLPDNTLPQSS